MEFVHVENEAVAKDHLLLALHRRAGLCEWALLGIICLAQIF